MRGERSRGGIYIIDIINLLSAIDLVFGGTGRL